MSMSGESRGLAVRPMIGLAKPSLIIDAGRAIGYVFCAMTGEVV
jgi:hypothetical protein